MELYQLRYFAYAAKYENITMAAKELNVHPNTVRYRLKRAAETTGWDATAGARIKNRVASEKRKILCAYP
jgi:sugar diacid utilization regulator